MTTTLGIKGKDYVILATESKATMGFLIASREAQKIHKITDKVWLTIAGSVGDAQKVINILQAEARNYRYSRRKPMSVKAIGSVAQQMAWRNFYPFNVMHVMAGYDTEPRLFSYCGDGSFMPESTITSTGSGSPFAYGVLETGYKPTMTKEAAIKLAKKAIRAAIQRDAGSGGDKLEMVVITADGEEYSEEAV